MAVRCQLRIVRFQSTRPPARTRRSAAYVRKVATRFQSTRTRARTRPARYWTAPSSCSFNPRVLAGGRDLVMTLNVRCLLCFNPRVLAGGRDAQESKVTEPILVSIHASSREDATQDVKKRRFFFCFNPRVLAGGRDRSIMINWKKLSVKDKTSSDKTRKRCYI